MSELFSAQPEPLANYNFGEMSSSIGWITLYGVIGNAAGTKILTPQAYDSDPNSTIVALVVSTTLIDYDFDILIGKQIIVYGKTVVNVPISLSNAGGPGTSSGYVTVLLRKWDGSTETEIASGQSLTKTAGAGATSYNNCSVILNVSTATTYKRGETLRITVRFYCDGVPTGGGNVTLHHNPRGILVTGSTDVYSDLKFPIPTKINL